MLCLRVLCCARIKRQHLCLQTLLHTYIICIHKICSRVAKRCTAGGILTRGRPGVRNAIMQAMSLTCGNGSECILNAQSPGASANAQASMGTSCFDVALRLNVFGRPSWCYPSQIFTAHLARIAIASGERDARHTTPSSRSTHASKVKRVHPDEIFARDPTRLSSLSYLRCKILWHKAGLAEALLVLVTFLFLIRV